MGEVSPVKAIEPHKCQTICSIILAFLLTPLPWCVCLHNPHNLVHHTQQPILMRRTSALLLCKKINKQKKPLNNPLSFQYTMSVQGDNYEQAIPEVLVHELKLCWICCWSATSCDWRCYIDIHISVEISVLCSINVLMFQCFPSLVSENFTSDMLLRLGFFV